MIRGERVHLLGSGCEPQADKLWSESTPSANRIQVTLLNFAGSVKAGRLEIARIHAPQTIKTQPEPH
jgi:hypothetical protein